jgi:acyl transferase domain-containing protein
MSDSNPGPAHGIAIVGIGARFPGAANADEFWRNLRDGVESITFFTAEELAAAGIDRELLRDPRYVRAKGVLAAAEMFDPAFFGFTPREAEFMDPQHRVFLECAWEACEDAGYDPQRLAGRAGVFAGAGDSAYLIFNLLPHGELMAKMGDLQAVLLNDRDFLATRVSYKLDLKGPSVTVQTACSTSLVAVHAACQSLLAGECDFALAGGVSIGVPLVSGYPFQEGGVMSPDGHCRAFDAGAAGSVLGNGCGVVALKRLADALADGDPVYAVVLGSAVNNDGAGKVGFTAPSVLGQAEAIAESLLIAAVEPDTVTYVEAHGSGTALGDPIEIAALTQAFRAATDRVGFCAVGSVKTNVGHCNTAAGVAGLIKTALALARRTIPPSLNFATPNPQIDFAASPFYVSTEASPWESADGAPRRAGVSSFGLGGTNAHAVLEEAPPRAAAPPPRRPWQLLPLSARTPGVLDAVAARLAARLEEEPALDLADVAYTLQVGRRAFERRRFVLACDAAEAAALLAAASEPTQGGSGVQEGTAARPVVFLFPGLGDQYVDMARELYEEEPAFRAEFDRCADLLAPHLGLDLRTVVFSPGEAAPARSAGTGAAAPDLRALLRRDARPADPAAARLAETAVAQPAHFAVEYALARLLMSWGIVPRAMIGYSIGEYVAAALAGVFSLADALALVARRARLIQELPAGAMLAVPLAEEKVRPLLAAVDPRLSLCAINGPHFCVAGGPAAAVEALADRLAADGATAIRLQTTHAFHSAMMEPAVAAFTEMARGVEMRPPQIPYLSNVTGTWIAAADLADPAYWARHMRQTVRFAEGLGELLARPERVLLEVGPGGTLATLARQHPAAAPGLVALTTLRRGSEEGSDVERLLDALGRLWAAGVEVDWQGFHGGERRLRVHLPTYPFERQRCWIDPPRGARPGLPQRPLAEERRDLADWFYVPVWKQAPPARRVRAVDPGANGAGAPREQAGDDACWLLFLDSCGLGERLAERLRAAGEAVVTVAPGAGFADLGGGAFALDPARRGGYDELIRRLARAGALPARMLHLWGVTPQEGEESDFAAAQQAGLFSLMFLEHALVEAAAGSSRIRIGMVANHLHEVLDGDRVHPAKATVTGACKVVHQESSRLTCTGIEVALPAAGAPDAAERLDRLAEQLLDEMALPAPEPAVAYRGRRRFVRAFEPVCLEGAAAASSRLREGGVYLLTDGVHGVGPALAEHLVRALRARVAVVVSPELPPQEQWQSWAHTPGGASAPNAQDAVGAALRRLLALSREPGAGELLVVRADAADPAALRAAVAQVRARFGALHGAFQTAGTFVGGLIQLKTAETLAAALEPLARGTEALLAAVAELPLDFVLLTSSTLAVTGGLGQLDLAAGGSWLDAVAQQRAAAGGPYTAVVHWDPYQWDGWLVAGVASLAGLQPQDTQKDLEANGIAARESAEALRRLLGSTLPRVVVSARDLGTLIEQVDAFTTESFLAEMEKARRAEGAHPRAGLATPYVAPQSELEERLAGLWQELFGIEQIGVEDNFLELGGHSLLAIQMITQVRNLCGVDLPVTVLFESPTITGLAREIARAQGGEEEEDPEELERLLAAVEALTPEEALQRMAEEMGVGS